MATVKRIGASTLATIKSDWTENIVSVSDTGVVVVSLPSGLTDNRPINLFAVFIPLPSIPAGPSPDLLIGSYPSASAPVPPDSTNGTPVLVTISVLGVPPGPYTVAIIGEYAE